MLIDLFPGGHHNRRHRWISQPGGLRARHFFLLITMTEEKKKKPGSAGRKHGVRPLTVAEKASAIALWRSGSVTLEGLSKKFGKRPEAFSRLFKKLTIEKGSSITDAAKALEAAAEVRAVSDLEETLKKIHATKDEHYRMSTGLAKLAWSELVRARQAGTDIAGLKDLMMTLKLAGDVIGNARKELFVVLDVEKHSQSLDEDDLPELTVRELSQVEVQELSSAIAEDDLLTDPGVAMMPDEEGA